MPAAKKRESKASANKKNSILFKRKGDSAIFKPRAIKRPKTLGAINSDDPGALIPIPNSTGHESGITKLANLTEA